MQSLPHLPNVTNLSNCVTRILGQNPGRYTLQGTCTYLVTHPSSSSAILLDTAQGFDSYLTHLRPLLSPSTQLTIVLSHWHEDHVGGLPGVLRLLRELGAPRPKVYKFPEAGPQGRERDQQLEDSLGQSAASASSSSSSTDEDLKTLVDPPSRPEDSLLYAATESSGTEPSTSTSPPTAGPGGVLRRLRHGQILGGGNLPELEVLHTPGHTADSVSLLCRSQSRSEDGEDGQAMLFTFDTVLGHGTAIFDDLRAYMRSLTTCIDVLEASGNQKLVRLLPGHGEVIQDGLAKLKEYRQHRQEREDQVIAALKTAEDKPQTAGDLCAAIYKDSIPESLIPAATRGLLLHLEKLEQDGRAVREAADSAVEEPLPGWFAAWQLSDSDDAEERAKF